MLNAEIRRPDAPGRFPVIVTITPYNGTNGAISVTNDYLVQRGYVQVIVDARGTGESQGTWDSFGTREQRDGYEIVEWAARSRGATATSACGARRTWRSRSSSPPRSSRRT